MKTKSKGWENRIVRSEMMRPDQIVPNPENWKIHTDFQKETVLSVLKEVGWVQQIVLNERTGRLIDGHLRLGLAIEEGVEQIPTLIVDLDENEERKILATLDPVAAYAKTDAEAYQNLVNSMLTDSLWLRHFTQTVMEKAIGQEEEEDEDGGSKKVQDGAGIPEMELHPFEHYDYLVLLFRNTSDWEQACERLKIGKMTYVIPQGTRKIGLGRVIDGGEAMSKLCAS